MIFAWLLDKSSIQIEHWISFFLTSTLYSSANLWRTSPEAPLDGVGSSGGNTKRVSLMKLTVTNTKAGSLRELSLASSRLISRAIFWPRNWDSGTCSSRRSRERWCGVKPPLGFRLMLSDVKTCTTPVSSWISSCKRISTVFVNILGRFATSV